MDIKRTQRAFKTYNSFDGGMQEFTSPLVTAYNESPFVSNMDVRRPGILSKTLGYSEVGSGTASGVGKGIGVFDQEDGTHTLLKLHKTQLSKWTGATWSGVVSGFTDNTTDKAEFVNAFLDSDERIYIATGFNDPITFWDGSASGTVSGIYAKHATYFNDQLYLGNVKYNSTEYPYRTIFSTELTDIFNTTTNFFDNIGEPITAMTTYAGNVCYFTENKLSLYDGYSLTQVPGNYGTTSARSVQVSEGRLLWYNRGGVYMYGGADKPVLISRKVQGVIDVIASPTSVAGGLDKYGRYLLYIGDITYNGTSYLDVCLRYDVNLNSWDFLPNRPFGDFALVKSGGTFISYAQDVDNDKVWQVDGSQSLNTGTMASEWQTAKFDVDLPDRMKNFYNVYITFKPQNVSEYVTVKYRLDGDSSWSQVGATNDNVDLSGTDLIKTQKLELPSNVQGKFLQLQFTHSSTTGTFDIYEIKLEFDVLN